MCFHQVGLSAVAVEAAAPAVSPMSAGNVNRRATTRRTGTPIQRSSSSSTRSRRNDLTNQEWSRGHPFAMHYFSSPQMADSALSLRINALQELAQLYVAVACGEPHPISQEEFQKMPEVCIGSTDKSLPDQQECGICLAEFCPDDMVKELPCKHWYHTACVKEWFTRQPTCPACRFDCRPGVRRGHGPFSASPAQAASRRASANAVRQNRDPGSEQRHSTRRELSPRPMHHSHSAAAPTVARQEFRVSRRSGLAL